MLTLLAITAAGQTSTTTRTKGAGTTTTKEETGTVTYVDGNTVVVHMASGELRTVTVPAGRTAIVDGKEIGVKDLKVGTTLTATYTTTTIPVTDRTVSRLTAKVWYVAAPNVILTLPDGTNKQYKATDDMKFEVGGQKATVFDLRKGMTITAEKIVEEPKTEVALNSTVTGHAPAAKSTAVASSQAPASSTRTSSSSSSAASTPAPAPVRAAAPPRAAAPTSVAAAPQVAENTPAATLPKTGSLLPLAGLIGMMLTFAGLGLRAFRRA